MSLLRPIAFIAHAADALRWAHFNIVTVAAHSLAWAHCAFCRCYRRAQMGPFYNRNSCCRWPRLGPLYALQMLPIHPDGPIKSPAGGCLCKWMGPLLQLLPMTSLGPIACPAHTADTFRWAHHISRRLLPIGLDGPSLQLLQLQQPLPMASLGPISFLVDTADARGWAHHIYLRVAADAPGWSQFTIVTVPALLGPHFLQVAANCFAWDCSFSSRFHKLCLITWRQLPGTIFL